MKTWLIAPLVVLLLIGIGALVWARRRKGDSPVTDQWLASHDYGKGGDDRQWK